MRFAMSKPVEANYGPAVDYTVAWLSTLNPPVFPGGAGVALATTNALAKAAAQGNEKASEALEKFSAAVAAAPPQPKPAARTPRDPGAPPHWDYLIGDQGLLGQVLASTNLMEARDDNGQTPLVWAVKAHRADFARQFLEHGAIISPPVIITNSDPHPRNNPSQNAYLASVFRDRAPLLAAVTGKDKEMTALLLEFHAPLDAVDQSGKTALHYAVANGDMDMVKLLVDANASLNVVDDEGQTPLFIAEAADNNEISDLLKQAAAARGVQLSGINAPTRDEMRILAQRICDGNMAAENDLSAAAAAMYQQINQPNNLAIRKLNADRMLTAFRILGTEAAKGNDNAFQALKKFLGEKGAMKTFAAEQMGTVAAAGNEEALNILLNYRQWGIMDSSAYIGLVRAAKANRQPAVDAVVNLLLDPEAAKKHYYGVSALAKQVAESAAEQGNEKAQQALEQLASASPSMP
jgi:ankyrin repeat protein